MQARGGTLRGVLSVLTIYPGPEEVFSCLLQILQGIYTNKKPRVMVSRRKFAGDLVRAPEFDGF